MNQFYIRKYVIIGIIIFFFIAILIKLFYLQVYSNVYKLSAENNILRYEYIYPGRGLIYDRNNIILVHNEAAYDLMVVPQLLKSFDTTELCSILEITPEYIVQKINEAKAYNKYIPSVFLKQLSDTTYAMLQEKLYKYSGFFVQNRSLRTYPKKIAAHLLGYVGEVDQEIIKNNTYYQLGDYIGISGIERSYEEELRGQKGLRIMMVDVYNRVKGSYRDARYDRPSVIGSDIVSTIDVDLQEYGERLMQNKIGSIVAIEPSTGEILCYVSAPSYDPSLLVGRKRADNYNILSIDSLKPLFNRPLMAKYPPGSTFKLINGMIALQEKIITPYTEFYCYGGFFARGVSVGCHNHPTPLMLVGAVQNSCNGYFCNVFRHILENEKYGSVPAAYDVWRNYVLSFGFGNELKVDLPNELKGFIPTKDYYNKYYGPTGWSGLTVISLAIGQGELGITPIQMANMVATIANRGFYYIPHVVKKIAGQDTINHIYTTPHYTKVDSSNFRPFIDGMDRAVNGPGGGTAWRARIPNIIVCGKTGTAENPHGEDHSIFVAFAPKNNSKIAIAIYVENGGFGNTYAAPIARLMIEKYMKDSITDPYLEKYILDANLLNKREKKN